MGCVRDPGSEEELATVGKLLSQVDRCREPSNSDALPSQPARQLLSLTPARLHPVWMLISPTCRSATHVTEYG